MGLCCVAMAEGAWTKGFGSFFRWLLLFEEGADLPVVSSASPISVSWFPGLVLLKRLGATAEFRAGADAAKF